MFRLFGFASSESSSLKKNKLGHFQTKNFNMFLSTVKPELTTTIVGSHFEFLL